MKVEFAAAKKASVRLFIEIRVRPAARRMRKPGIKILVTVTVHTRSKVERERC